MQVDARPFPFDFFAMATAPGILPVINTGIAHRDAGVGQIGAGITHAPFACFTATSRALSEGLSAP